MRVIPFPGSGTATRDEAWLAELEAALSDDGKGANSWRELRDDVRQLAPPMDPRFERELSERILQRNAHSEPKRPHRRLAWLHRHSLLGAAAIVAITAVLVLLSIPGAPRPGRSGQSVPAQQVFPSLSTRGPDSASRSASPAVTSATGSISGGASFNAPASGGAPGRVQQIAASLTLTTAPNNVQSVADRVSRLAVNNQGFVQSSHVQVQQADTSEASLTLRLPSAKLSGALASLGALAPIRAESQSLQDITSTYDAARQRVADTTAERQALLHALARAATEGQLDSLHERLSQARAAIAQARSALRTVSQHATTAEVEVTVLGDARAASEGLTLHTGLHDAGRVLIVTLVALLLAATILLPLALLLIVLVPTRRAWRRYRRERVLDAT